MRALALDLLCMLGLASFVWGCHQVYPPAAAILGGLILSAGAVAAARKVAP